MKDELVISELSDMNNLKILRPNKIALTTLIGPCLTGNINKKTSWLYWVVLQVPLLLLHWTYKLMYHQPQINNSNIHLWVVETY